MVKLCEHLSRNNERTIRSHNVLVVLSQGRENSYVERRVCTKTAQAFESCDGCHAYVPFQTEATVRVGMVFRWVDTEQAHEIPEAYYKTMEGLYALAELLEVADVV